MIRFKKYEMDFLANEVSAGRFKDMADAQEKFNAWKLKILKNIKGEAKNNDN